MRAAMIDASALGRARLIAFGVAAVVGALVVGRLGYYAWTVDAFGLSVMSGKPPTWDFTNLWMGGRLVLTQSVEAVFQPEPFRAAMRAMFGATVEPSEWSYPPSLLLIGAPLAELPLGLAYWLFTFGGIVALMLACRAGGFSWPLCVLVAISPAVLFNVVFGQNGAWTAALLLGALLTSERRPMLAGLLLGLLTMKPHLGVLAPLCLIAAGHWRAFGWAAFFSLAIAGLTTALFGFDAWRLFLTETRPLMQAILEAPWGTEDYQMNGATVFHLARALGGGVGAAYAAQAVAAVGAAVAAWTLWRRPGADPLLRAAATALLTLIASPYGWTYDLAPLSVALVAIAARDRRAKPAALAAAFFYPAVNNRAAFYALPVAPLVIAGVAFAAYRAAFRDAPPEGERAGAPAPGAACAA